MNNLPYDLFIETLNNSNYKIIEELNCNSEKETIVLLIIKESKKFIFKGCFSSESKKCLEFRKEISYYNKINYNVFELKSNCFIIDYFDSITLGDYFFKNKLNKNNLAILLKNLKKEINQFQRANSILSNNFSFDNGYNNLYRLYYSKPKQFTSQKNKRSRLPYLFLKFILFILFYCIKFFYRKQQIGAHCDFHYNNILINDNLEILIIDFENFDQKCLFIFDIIYLHVMINKLLGTKLSLNNSFKNYYENKILYKMVKYVYEKAIKGNISFQLKSM